MSSRPNVLLIVTDQQRWDSLSCEGGFAPTANLDHIAAAGTRFRSAYSSTPSCTAARASLLTGRDPWRTGILGMGPSQPPLAGLTETLPEVLGRAGYQTHGVGKMHFTPQRARYGFDEMILPDDYYRELRPPRPPGRAAAGPAHRRQLLDGTPVPRAGALASLDVDGDRVDPVPRETGPDPAFLSDDLIRAPPLPLRSPGLPL